MQSFAYPSQIKESERGRLIVAKTVILLRL